MARTEGNIRISAKEFDQVNYAHSQAVSAGEVLVLNAATGLVGIALEAGAANESIAYYIDGVHRLPIASGVTVTQFAVCYWDVSENEVILTSPAAGDPIVGIAAAAGTAAGGYVDVILNHTQKAIVIAEGTHTTAGGDATESITVTGAVATDKALVYVSTVGSTPRTVSAYTCASDAITVTMSGDPSTDHVLTYMVWRTEG